MTPLSVRYQHAAAVDRLRMFAQSLGVRTESLIDFGIGWSSDQLAWSFPMTDPTTGKVIGMRLRRPDGKKFAVTGSKDGLFLVRSLPPDFTPDPSLLLIAEGATDAIAAHTVGFVNVAGRPSCTGGTKHLIALVRSKKPHTVAIVADNDDSGVRGAEALARTLALYTQEVRVIAPPSNKDLRSWVLTGATRTDVEQLIQSVAPRRYTMRLTRETQS